MSESKIQGESAGPSTAQPKRCTACNVLPDPTFPFPYCHFCRLGLLIECCKCDKAKCLGPEPCAGCGHDNCKECAWSDDEQNLICCKCKHTWKMDVSEAEDGSGDKEEFKMECQWCQHGICAKCKAVLENVDIKGTLEEFARQMTYGLEGEDYDID